MPQNPDPTRWVRLFVTREQWEREIFGATPFVLNEAPRTPFDSITLANDHETGLFARKALPATEVPKNA